MTTQKLGWYAQPFPPDGGSAAEGLRNQLGRPSLSLLTVLARESAQNSWDAKDSAQVDFTVELSRVSPVHLPAWRSLLSTGMPVADSEQFPLRQTLRNPSITILSVSDRGTAGLSGPTRSDQVSHSGRRNWLSFVLNSGEARDVDGGGGTYGYGKGIFFLVSRVGSIVIHSRFREGDRIRSRLIGSVLWRQFEVQETPYTGRHWWGATYADHCEPLENEDADRVAQQLGLASFAEGETGTTVVVIDPLLPDPAVPEGAEEQFDLMDAGRFLADAIGYNLWPIMLEGRTPRLVPRVIVSGVDVPVPDATTDPVITQFAKAYRALDDPQQFEQMTSGNRRTPLARFAYTTTFGATTESSAAADLGITGAPHHVCLLRRPDLVVRYLPGPVGPHPMVGYAALAKVDDNLDETFAKAEPPTHDAWIDTQLQGSQATFVRVLHSRIKQKLEELAGTKRQPANLADLPVAAVSSRLGHLLAGSGGGGPSTAGTIPGAGTGPAGGSGGFGGLVGGSGRPVGRHSSGNQPRARTPQLRGSPMFVGHDQEVVLEQLVHLPGSGTYDAVVDVLLSGGAAETDPFAGARHPEIIGWRHPDGEFSAGEQIQHTGKADDVVLLIRPVQDAALRITVRAGR